MNIRVIVSLVRFLWQQTKCKLLDACFLSQKVSIILGKYNRICSLVWNSQFQLHKPFCIEVLCHSTKSIMVLSKGKDGFDELDM